jgi:uncharacterized protein YoxC
METALTVAKVIALLAVAAPCVYLIVLLARVRESIATINVTVKDVAAHVVPVLDNVEFLTTKVNSIAETVEEQMGIVEQSVDTLKTVTDTIAQFEHDIQSRVEGPIRETASVVRAVSKGVKSFIERVRT